MYLWRYIIFVILVSLYRTEQLTISCCDYWFDVSNIAVGWVRVTTLYVIWLFFVLAV